VVKICPGLEEKTKKRKRGKTSVQPRRETLAKYIDKSSRYSDSFDYIRLHQEGSIVESVANW